MCNRINHPARRTSGYDSSPLINAFLDIRNDLSRTPSIITRARRRSLHAPERLAGDRRVASRTRRVGEIFARAAHRSRRTRRAAFHMLTGVRDHARCPPVLVRRRVTRHKNHVLLGDGSPRITGKTRIDGLEIPRRRLSRISARVLISRRHGRSKLSPATLSFHSR